MTTSSQPSVLTTEELASLRDCAEGREIVPAACEALAAKGLLQREDGHYILTPAARHTLHQNGFGMVPGIDN